MADRGIIVDASGDASLLDTLIARLRRGGAVVLAGFYEQPLAFTFPPAFMREAMIRIAAEFRPEDVDRAWPSSAPDGSASTASSPTAFPRLPQPRPIARPSKTPTASKP